MMMVEHDVLVPNDLVKFGNQTLRLRYITRHGFQYRYHFQPSNEPLNPLIENVVVIMSVNKDQGLKLEVIPQ
jgi:hypothetical protein